MQTLILKLISRQRPRRRPHELTIVFLGFLPSRLSSLLVIVDPRPCRRLVSSDMRGERKILPRRWQEARHHTLGTPRRHQTSITTTRSRTDGVRRPWGRLPSSFSTSPGHCRKNWANLYTAAVASSSASLSSSAPPEDPNSNCSFPFPISFEPF